MNYVAIHRYVLGICLQDTLFLVDKGSKNEEKG